ncbi:GntR family transcriptional regulator [Oceanibium sediminis]|uniref:GntR family transcriptional regulator n=1 Tax=Oceanibium sediminis TaxID=2026339 RepID=UPI000DD46DC1|nr:GntR family transcriptional regulator [Oceanibium sediminis]
MPKREASDVDAAYQEISSALLEGRLRPGMPLRERQLAEIFGLTRGAVRKVLLRLGTEGKVKVIPNRGAFVPQPTRKDVQTVYDARRAVEAGLVGLLATRITPEQIATLRRNIHQHSRTEENTRETTVRLSGGFHNELVHMIGSPVLEEIVANLVSRTQVLVALFEPERESGCAPTEHEEIVAALEAGDSARAFKVMIWHLNQVEGRILAHLDQQEATDLEQVLRSAFGKGKG